MAKPELLVDTSYVVALVHKRDQYHETARRLARRLRAHAKLVITQAVCLEIGNFLSDPPNRPRAAQMLTEIQSDPGVEIVPMSEKLYSEALTLFTKRPDKEWSMIDCVSFVVMTERGITEALTADGHFEQAGFKPLMREAG
ncbi:MAG TPA: PIN domain-containing protein [Longimicrobium sp.]|nr:PIN domain-containing protein [Longimicrobium sp.]